MEVKYTIDLAVFRPVTASKIHQVIINILQNLEQFVFTQFGQITRHDISMLHIYTTKSDLAIRCSLFTTAPDIAFRCFIFKKKYMTFDGPYLQQNKILHFVLLISTKPDTTFDGPHLQQNQIWNFDA